MSAPGQIRPTQGRWVFDGVAVFPPTRPGAAEDAFPVAEVLGYAGRTPEEHLANGYLIAAAPAYARAWAMVPEEIRERILAAGEPWVAEDIEAAKARGAS